MKPKPEKAAMSLLEDSEFQDAYPFTFDELNSQDVLERSGEWEFRPRRTARRPAPHPADLKWNVMTVLVLLMTAFTVMAFLSIHNNPYIALNPLPPAGAPTLVAAVVIPTSTGAPEQPTVLAPQAITSTSEPPTATPTTAPTATLAPTSTPTPGPSPTATVHSLFPFAQRGETKTIDGATFHAGDECYLWVAGQAYDLQGAPMVGVTVMLGGWLDGKYINQLSLTGTALQYGQAGYEFIIAEQPVESSEGVWVQLFDQAMVPLSNRVFFDTYADCSQNLVLVNFRQVR